MSGMFCFVTFETPYELKGFLSNSEVYNCLISFSRCKSTTALLYACKYETGSKGKCINLGNEWLTPNEFEDRAGSKAKKYLSR